MTHILYTCYYKLIQGKTSIIKEIILSKIHTIIHNNINKNVNYNKQ